MAECGWRCNPTWPPEWLEQNRVPGKWVFEDFFEQGLVENQVKAIISLKGVQLSVFS